VYIYGLAGPSAGNAKRLKTNMLDSKYLRQDIEQAAARLATRGFELDIDAVTALEEKRKTLQVKTQELQSERNASSKAIRPS